VIRPLYFVPNARPQKTAECIKNFKKKPFSIHLSEQDKTEMDEFGKDVMAKIKRN